MSPEEKLKNIQERFGLTNDHLKSIVHCREERLVKLLNETSKLKENEIEHICETFGIKNKNFVNKNYILPKLTMKIKIDISKYKNLISAYVGIIKEYYPKPWEVYVLAKIRNKTSFEKFIEIFVTNKKSLEETDIFTPNYLAIKEEQYLIINLENNILEVQEIGDLGKNKRFIYGKYRYARANKVMLERYVPDVTNYNENF